MLAVVVSLIMSAPRGLFAMSSNNLGSSMPWESPLSSLQRSLTGPVAQAVCLIAIVICGLTLIFGGEIGEFAKRIIYIVIVVAFVLGATSFIGMFTSGSGALM